MSGVFINFVFSSHVNVPQRTIKLVFKFFFEYKQLKVNVLCFDSLTISDVGVTLQRLLSKQCDIFQEEFKKFKKALETFFSPHILSS